MTRFDDALHDLARSTEAQIRTTALGDTAIDLGPVMARTRHRRRVRAAATAVGSVAAVALVGAVAVAAVPHLGPDPLPPASQSPTEPGPTPEPTTPGPTTPSPEPSRSPEVTPSPSTVPTEEPAPTTPPLSDAYPDPASLVGQRSYDTRDADGTWRVVVGEETLDLVNTFGACIDGGTDDVCAYSLSGATDTAPGDVPGPTDHALLMFSRSLGHAADGTPLWEVLDAILTTAPDGPAYLELCDGTDDVVFYPAGPAGPDGLIPVSRAWGPDASYSRIVEVAPDSLSCRAVGD